MTTEAPRWFTSSYSDHGGQCVEVAVNLAGSRGVVPVRDTKDPSSPVLGFPTSAFATFLAGVKLGEFG